MDGCRALIHAIVFRRCLCLLGLDRMPEARELFSDKIADIVSLYLRTNKWEYRFL